MPKDKRHYELESRKDEIIRTWEENGRNCKRTARVLDIPDSTLRDKLKSWELKPVSSQQGNPTPPPGLASHPEEMPGLEKETPQEMPVSQEKPAPPPPDGRPLVYPDPEGEPDRPASDKDIALAQISALRDDKAVMLQEKQQQVLQLEEEMLSLQEDIEDLEKVVFLLR